MVLGVPHYKNKQTNKQNHNRMGQRCVNSSRIKKKREGKRGEQIKIDKRRIFPFHISINSYLDITNGKETL